MSTVVFRNKTGGSETLYAAPGQNLLDVLRLHGIPANAVLAYRNGAVIPESAVVVEPDDVIEVRQVRHYDLDVLRKPKEHVYAAPDPVYSKSVLFDHGGTLERRTEQLTAETFVQYVEETFVQSITSGGTMRAGDRAVIGLSGGRDSVAYLKLLERTRGRWPEIDMTAVTITGLPDWDEPATFQIALDSCAGLGLEHTIVTADDVADVFKLREPFVDVMNKVVAGEHRNMNMVIGHQVLRRMLEREAGRAGASVVAFGFNADDLVASMVTWFTTGYRMGGIPVRELGDLRYVFPLYRITKKELTLYLELVAPELSRRAPRAGSPPAPTNAPWPTRWPTTCTTSGRASTTTCSTPSRTCSAVCCRWSTTCAGSAAAGISSWRACPTRPDCATCAVSSTGRRRCGRTPYDR